MFFPSLLMFTMATAAATSAADSSSDAKQARQKKMPFLRPNDLPGLMGENYDPKQADNWMSVSEDVEFLPLLNNNNDKNNKPKKAARRKTRSLEEQGEEATSDYANYDPYSTQPFVEGMSEYDEYQQAWRLLGFMIDCNTINDDDYEASGGSGDGVTEEGCARYVLWAAYVDLEYEDGGIGEYQYWDRSTNQWNDTACQYAENGSGGSQDGDDDNGESNSRCAKMDCHLEDTHFSVLGFFKHRNYDDWMEQLFKHEGMCVWTDEEYAFMKNARKAWPEGCVDSGSTIAGDDDDGVSSTSTSLYYNIKPLQNGRIAVGLYTDSQCVTDYPSDTDMIEDIVGNIFLDGSGGSQDEDTYDFSGDTLTESMNRWDSAFDVWHTCHPCVAHDLENTAGDKYYTNNNYYYNGQYYYYGNRKQRRERGLGGEYSAQGDVFECYDDAGYTNVNQCMKFSAKTVMKTATFRDLSLARNQGSLVVNPLSGYFDAGEAYSGNTMGNMATYLFFVSVSSALCFSLWNLYKVSKETGRSVDGATHREVLLS